MGFMALGVCVAEEEEVEKQVGIWSFALQALLPKGLTNFKIKPQAGHQEFKSGTCVDILD